MKLAFKRLAVAAALAMPVVVSAAADFVPPAPTVAGRAFYLMDYYSGQVLATSDPDKRIEPASLTKLMTAYLTFKAIKAGHLRLDQTLPTSVKAWKTEGSRMFIDPRKPATVDQLIKGMIVVSGNDACVTVAEALGGSEEGFAQMMTAQAQALGMKNTQFRNSTGLPDPQHYTTVHDLGILATALVRDFPDFYPVFATKEFTYNNIHQPNRDLLLNRDASVDGMKTGYTDAAGYNMVTSSHRGDRRVISVVVGTASPEARAQESLKLLNYGMQFFETPKLYQAMKPVSQVKLYKGAENSVPVGFDRDVFATVYKGQGARLKADMVTNRPLLAPIQAGQVVGKLTVSLDGKPLLERPVVALKSVEQAGFIGRLWDSLKLMLGM
jgi:D-alanyl-D-alanine carboxypeptidase (penicillin-binding protein 5/6)